MEDSTRIHDNLYYDERSAGGIVYKLENGRTWWLVIKTLTKRQLNRMGERVRRTVYKFPKGHLDKGEVLKKAALREVEEEGQVISKIVTKIGSNDYIIWDKESKKKIIKKVTFFLMEYEAESRLKYFDNETVLERLWLSEAEAIDKLAYNSEKILLNKAVKKLNERLKRK